MTKDKHDALVINAMNQLSAVLERLDTLEQEVRNISDDVLRVHQVVAGIPVEGEE